MTDKTVWSILKLRAFWILMTWAWALGIVGVSFQTNLWGVPCLLASMVILVGTWFVLEFQKES